MKPHPRLAFIIYSPFPRYSGGRENFLNEFLPRVALHADVAVVAYRSDQRVFYRDGLDSVTFLPVTGLRVKEAVFRFLNLIFLRLPLLFDLFVLFPTLATRTLHRFKPTLVLSLNALPEGLVRSRNAKHIVWVRGLVADELSSTFPPLRLVLPWLERWAARRADLVLANGNDTQAYLASSGIPAIVIPNGVDVPRFREQHGRDSSFEELRALREGGYRIVLSVATLRPIKGVAHLIRAAVHVKSQRVMFVLAGKGDRRSHEREARSLGVADRFLFIGEQRNVSGLLAHADIVACLSGGGGISMALLEALAAGRAVVAWNTPPYQSVVTDRLDAVLVPDADDRALAAAIDELLGDEAMRAALGANATKRAEGYDWSVVVDKFLLAVRELWE